MSPDHILGMAPGQTNKSNETGTIRQQWNMYKTIKCIIEHKSQFLLWLYSHHSHPYTPSSRYCQWWAVAAACRTTEDYHSKDSQSHPTEGQSGGQSHKS